LKRKKERKAHHPITYFFVEFPCWSWTSRILSRSFYHSWNWGKKKNYPKSIC
jgi:hypothetical protein